MRKIENLNNVRKTVLKLEKEINAISNNLSKVKNKDHSTMKNIINNINVLLTQNSIEKNIFRKEFNNLNEDRKIDERNQTINKDNHPNYINERNIDYLFLLNKQKIKNNKKESKSYFNKKSISSSKFNIKNTEEEKKIIYNKNSNLNLNITIDEIKNSNKNKIIEIPNNKDNSGLNRTNLITYSKPKLMTEYSKKKLKINKNILNQTNNSFKINKKLNEQMKNLKHLSSKDKNNKNNNNKNNSILNSLYYNYKDNSENNIYPKEIFLNDENINKITFSHDEPKINKSQKDYNYDKEYNLQEFEKDFDIISSIKKNKKLILEKKINKNQKKDLIINNCINQNNIYNNYNYQSNLNNIYNRAYIKPSCLSYDDYLNKNNLSEKIVKSDNKNYINSFHNQNNLKSNENSDLFYLENNFNSLGNISSQRKVKEIKDKIYRNKSFNKSINQKNLSVKKNINNNKINQLLKMLKANNINEAIDKINKLLKYENELNEFKEFYNQNFVDNEKLFKYSEREWLSKIIKRYESNKKYKNYCKSIMNNFKIKNFNNFKMFINDILSENKKMKSSINDINEILYEDNQYYNNINNINRNTHINNKYNIKTKLNYEINNKENISDNNANFTEQNNYKMITEYMNAFY